MDNTVMIQEKANEKMQAGINCCESVFWSVLEVSDKAYDQKFKSLASIFGGGVADTGDEMCGALSGALLVLSYDYGRTSSVDSNQVLMEKGARLRAEFQRINGPSVCKALKNHMLEKDGLIDCRKVVRQTIEILEEFTNLNQNELN
jgi:C_GCAxxG_C_C family probable redox protein